MIVNSLQISNIWSFKYFENIEDAPKITFNEKLNILIGQNGAGKSSALEVINFIFRRVLFVPYSRNQDFYSQRTTIDLNQKRSILAKTSNWQFYRGFRLEPNFNFENQKQMMRIVIEIDEIDRANIEFLQENRSKLSPLLDVYSAVQMFGEGEYQEKYQIDIELNSSDKTFKVSPDPDMGLIYLTAYNLYKEVIDLYNEENPDSQIRNLAESFSLIGSYRNYNTYVAAASLGGGNTADKQIQQVKTGEYSKSMNSPELAEPTVFSLVRLRMASECFNLIGTNKSKEECERAANELEFIIAINEKIAIVNLKVEIKLTDISNWNFAFSFIDTKRSKAVADISSLSAGQKAIVHLIFESYGRGNLKGGLVIIDEPEIHLHYQFQNEYLRIIEKLNLEQGCQYILVTHSESLISSDTIDNVVRLSLDESGYTKVNQPQITTSQKWLVKILDNKRSTHAFFGRVVLLVEGETDRYFFRAFLGEMEEKLKKGLAQDISVLDIEGKSHVLEWRQLFEPFGLKIFSITDLDSAWQLYSTECEHKLNSQTDIEKFLTDHTDVIEKIDDLYASGKFILKEGDLETYLGVDKGLEHVIKFCEYGLSTFIENRSSVKVQEIRKIMSCVTGESESSF